MVFVPLIVTSLTSNYKQKEAASRTRAGEKYLTDENFQGKRSAEPHSMRSPPSDVLMHQAKKIQISWYVGFR